MSMVDPIPAGLVWWVVPKRIFVELPIVLKFCPTQFEAAAHVCDLILSENARRSRLQKKRNSPYHTSAKNFTGSDGCCVTANTEGKQLETVVLC